MIPLLVLLMAVLLQVGSVVHDQLRLVTVTSGAARAAMVEPTEAATRSAVGELGADLQVSEVELRGPRSAGSLLVVRVAARPRRLPLVGAAVAGMTLSEEVVVRVEG